MYLVPVNPLISFFIGDFPARAKCVVFFYWRVTYAVVSPQGLGTSWTPARAQNWRMINTTEESAVKHGIFWMKKSFFEVDVSSVDEIDPTR